MANIYRLAKEKDIKSLQEIVNSGKSISIFEGQYNAIILLAKEKNVDAVQFLISNFNASPFHALQGFAISGDEEKVNSLIQILGGKSVCDAIRGYAQGGYNKLADQLLEIYAGCGYELEGYDLEGYALGGHTKIVDEKIATGANRKFALSGYAKSGRIDEVNKQIEAGAEIAQALLAFAEGGYSHEVEKIISEFRSELSNCDLTEIASKYLIRGHLDEAEQLIANHESEQDPLDRNSLVAYYALGGFIDKVNILIAQGASRKEAEIGYLESYYCSTPYNLIYLLSLTQDEELCNLIVDGKKKIFYSMISTTPVRETSQDIDYAFRISHKLKLLNKENELNYIQAVAYLELSKNWLMQGMQLTNHIDFNGNLTNNNLPLLPIELYKYITKFLTGLSIEDNEKLLATVNKRIARKKSSLTLSDTKEQEKTEKSISPIEVNISATTEASTQHDILDYINKENEVIPEGIKDLSTSPIEELPKEENQHDSELKSPLLEYQFTEENRFSFFANNQQEESVYNERCKCTLL